jgi:hypothetical protein
MATWIDECMQLVEDCENRESRLTEWEQNFVDSIRNRLEQEKPITEKQAKTLDRIWEKATENG